MLEQWSMKLQDNHLHIRKIGQPWEHRQTTRNLNKCTSYLKRSIKLKKIVWCKEWRLPLFASIFIIEQSMYLSLCVKTDTFHIHEQWLSKRFFELSWTWSTWNNTWIPSRSRKEDHQHHHFLSGLFYDLTLNLRLDISITLKLL